MRRWLARTAVQLALLSCWVGSAMADGTVTDDIMDGARTGDLEIVSSAIAAGANVNVQEPGSGSTPLHFAVARGYSNVVEALLERGCDPNLKNSVGMTPIMVAANQGRSELTMLLATKAHGIDLNVGDQHGLTPLMHAASGGDTTKRLLLVQRLVNAGANHLLQTREGKTAYDIALDYGNHQIADYLRRLDSRGNVIVSCATLPKHEQAACEAMRRAEAAFNTDVHDIQERHQKENDLAEIKKNAGLPDHAEL